jgi:4-amino-4-deoxy-L-arabinose transferase-like glycosyltransferase
MYPRPLSEPMREWPLLVMLLLLPIWSVGLFHRGIWMPDEPREYAIGVGMLNQGDLLIPRLAGNPFLEKPPLAYWAQSASMHLFGASAAAARLPNLLWALVAALCIGMLAGDLAPSVRRTQAAVLAALTFGTMILVVQVQMWLATDAPLVAMTAAALLSAWRLMHASTRLQQFGYGAMLGVSLAGAFLAKNGFGLLVPLLALLGWLSWERRLRYLLQWPLWAAAGWFALCVAPWLIALVSQPDGREHLHVLLWDNLITRFLPVNANADYDLGHRGSGWKFLLRLPIYVMPWTLAWGAAASWSLRILRTSSQTRSAVRFCIAATLPACFVLLLSRTGRDVYFVPALVGGSVLLALWLTACASGFSRIDRLLLTVTERAMQVLVVLLVVATIGLAALVGFERFSLAVMLAFAASVLVGTHFARQGSDAVLRSMIGTTGVFLAALGMFEVVVFPLIDRAENVGALVVQAQARLKSGRVALYCGDETIRATLDYAIGLRPQNVCKPSIVARLLREHADQEFLVEVQPPASTERIEELFPTANRWMTTSPWKAKSPASAPVRLADLIGLDLQPVADWSVPGGRRYALYGRKPAR